MLNSETVKPEVAASIPGTEMSIFAPDGIARLEQIDNYRSVSPFPHLVIDNIFNNDMLRMILQEWPSSGNDSELHDDGTYVKKKFGTTWKTKFGPFTQKFFAEMAGPSFLKTLEKVTGMWGLMPDPYMFGGGLHATATGGKLAIHADFNKHPFFKVDRRLNLLVYLNEGWTDENGGWLELWDREMRAASSAFFLSSTGW